MRKQSTGLFTVKSVSTFEFRGSSPSALTAKQKKTPTGVFLFWQGQKDLNPRHAVLETAALPTELYPYIWWAIRDSNPGPTGYEPVALTN